MGQEDEHQERKKAIRLHRKGIKHGEIRKRTKRSGRWLRKWIKRYETGGWAGLRSQSRAPDRHVGAYAARVGRAVKRARAHLEKCKVGLICINHSFI